MSYLPVGDDMTVQDAINQVVRAGTPPTLTIGPVNLDQTTTGSSITAADFDSTTYSGICKPKNNPAFKAVEYLQQQLNRVAKMKGFGRIGVDGAVGPATLGLFKQVQLVSRGQVMGDPNTCLGVAADADVIGPQVKDLADSLGAPASVPAGAPATNRTVIATDAAGRKQEVPGPSASLLDSFNNLGTTEKFAIVGFLGLIGYFVYKGRKNL